MAASPNQYGDSVDALASYKYVQQIFKAAGFTWAEMKEVIPKEILDVIDKNLRNIENYQEQLVDAEFSVQDVLVDLFRLNLQNCLFLDLVQNLKYYITFIDKNEIKSSDRKLKEFTDTLNYHITASLKKFTEIEVTNHQPSKRTVEFLGKMCTMVGEKASNARYRDWVKQVLQVAAISFAGLVIVPTFLLSTLPAAVAGTLGVDKVELAGGGIRFGAELIICSLTINYTHSVDKYSQLIESFKQMRQVVDQVQQQCNEMYKSSMNTKTKLEAIQATVQEVEFHVQNKHSMEAINFSVDTLLHKLDKLQDYLSDHLPQPV